MGDGDYYGDVNFDGYRITTINPGWHLLLGTGLSCFLCFLLGFLCIPEWDVVLQPLWWGQV